MRIDTLSPQNVITRKASKTNACCLVEGVALRTDCSADSISVEEAYIGAFDAGSTGPGFAKEVAFGDNTQIIVDNTGAVGDDVAEIAGDAGSAVAPCGAEVADGVADFIGVEIPTHGAFCTGSVLPGCASNVFFCFFVNLCAFAVDHRVSLVALLADSLLSIELLAGALDLTADSLAVEEVSIRALEAGFVAPYFTAKIVIEGSKERSVVEFLS